MSYLYDPNKIRHERARRNNSDRCQPGEGKVNTRRGQNAQIKHTQEESETGPMVLKKLKTGVLRKPLRVVLPLCGKRRQTVSKWENDLLEELELKIPRLSSVPPGYVRIVYKLAFAQVRLRWTTKRRVNGTIDSAKNHNKLYKGNGFNPSAPLVERFFRTYVWPNPLPLKDSYMLQFKQGIKAVAREIIFPKLIKSPAAVACQRDVVDPPILAKDAPVVVAEKRRGVSYLLFKKTRLPRTSQISGAQGEWTGSDDVELEEVEAFVLDRQLHNPAGLYVVEYDMEFDSRDMVSACAVLIARVSDKLVLLGLTDVNLLGMGRLDAWDQHLAEVRLEVVRSFESEGCLPPFATPLTGNPWDPFHLDPEGSVWVGWSHKYVHQFPRQGNPVYDVLPDVHSQLNGANGEVTGTDDLDNISLLSDDSGSKRRRRKVKVPSVLVFVPSVNVNGEELFGLTPNLLLITKNDRGLWLDSAGGTWHPMRAGTILEAQQMAPGVYDIAGDAKKHKLLRLQPAFTLRTLPEAKCADLKCAERTYMVADFMLEDLFRKFPAIRQTSRSIRAVRTQIVRSYPCLVNMLLTDLFDCFRHETLLKENTKLTPAKPLLEDDSLFEQPPELEIRQTYQDLMLDAAVHSMWQQRAEDCPVPPDLTWNGNVIITKSSGWRFLSEVEKSPVGEFNTKKQGFDRAKWYKTLWFQISGKRHFILYDNNGLNAGLATARLFKARKDEMQLRLNQSASFQEFPTPWGPEIESNCLYPLEGEPDPASRVIFRLLRITLQDHFPQGLISGLSTTVVGTYYVGTDYLRRAFIYLAAKRRLYWQMYDRRYALIDDTSAALDAVQAKVKFEDAKPGKFPRLFVTYNSHIVHAGFVWDFLKSQICRVYNIADSFRNTDLAPLASKYPGAVRVWKALAHDRDLSKDNFFYADVFSDDQSVRIGDSLYDVDISSCDTGQTSGILRVVSWLLVHFGFERYVPGIFSVLKQEIILVNPSNQDEYIKMKPRDILYGSGHGVTTTGNHLASLAGEIGSYFCLLRLAQKRGVSPEALSAEDHIDCITRGFAFVGHVVTVEPRACLAATQYLKYSPLEDSCGRLVSCLNLGPILRGLGSVQGDLTPEQIGVSYGEFRKMSTSEKCERFIRTVVSGYTNEPGNIILNALRSRFGKGGPLPVGWSRYLCDLTNRSAFFIPTSSLIKRYGGEEFEWEQLASSLSQLDVGHMIHSEVVSRIFHVDYGLPLG